MRIRKRAYTMHTEMCSDCALLVMIRSTKRYFKIRIAKNVVPYSTFLLQYNSKMRFQLGPLARLRLNTPLLHAPNSGKVTKTNDGPCIKCLNKWTKRQKPIDIVHCRRPGTLCGGRIIRRLYFRVMLKIFQCLLSIMYQYLKFYLLCSKPMWERCLQYYIIAGYSASSNTMRRHMFT